MHLIANSLGIDISEVQRRLNGSQLDFNREIKKCMLRYATFEPELAKNISTRGYAIGQEIGRGGNSIVYLVKNKKQDKISMQRYCAMVVSSDGSYDLSFISEIIAAQKQGALRSVASIFDYFRIKDTTILFLELLTPLNYFALSRSQFLLKFEAAVENFGKKGGVIWT